LYAEYSETVQKNLCKQSVENGKVKLGSNLYEFGKCQALLVELDLLFLEIEKSVLIFQAYSRTYVFLSTLMGGTVTSGLISDFSTK